MRTPRVLILWLWCISAFADWKDTQFLYFWNGITAGVALTSTTIFGINHAVGPFTSVQIGDQTGPLPSYCTGFVNCPLSIQNCEWVYDHQNITNDRLLFVTCRPVTNGITYVATNVVVGTPVVWFSTITQGWITGGVVTFIIDEAPVTFPDGSTATLGTFLFNGPQAVSGDSGSPVFLAASGDFLGSVTSLSIVGTTVGRWAYPSGSHTRPVPAARAGLSALFPYFSPP